MINGLVKVEELAMRIGSSVPTISSWYRWKRANPEHEMAKMLPEFERHGAHRTRYWREEDIEKIMEFKRSIPQGRNGVMGSITQKYVKKDKKEDTREFVIELTDEEENNMNNKIAYITKYQKENTIQINLRLSKKYDVDLIEWLNALEDKGKATYLKELIRADMEQVKGDIAV